MNPDACIKIAVKSTFLQAFIRADELLKVLKKSTSPMSRIRNKRNQLANWIIKQVNKIEGENHDK